MFTSHSFHIGTTDDDATDAESAITISIARGFAGLGQPAHLHIDDSVTQLDIYLWGKQEGQLANIWRLEQALAKLRGLILANAEGPLADPGAR